MNEKDEKKVEHNPRYSTMRWKGPDGRTKELKILFCTRTNEVLRNFTWKKKDDELQKKYNYRYSNY